MKRYPWAPLAAAMGLSEHAATVELGLSGSTAQQYRRDGVTERVADRLASRAGLHAFVIWPELAADVEADRLEELRARWRAAAKRQREKHPDRIRERKARYAEEARPALRAYKRRWNAENRDRVAGHSRAYRARQSGQEAAAS